MKIGLGYRLDHRADGPVETYARCFHQELEERGHEVVPIGAGHDIKTPDEIDTSTLTFHLDIDNGRDSKGDFQYFRPRHSIKTRTAVWFIDSHGQPTLHRRKAKHYDHVFFAVWARRDLFQGHKSSWWCPNATDSRWFSYKLYPAIRPTVDFGFFGSRGGICRADPLKELCIKNGWTYDIAQVAKPFKHKWPKTPKRMAGCRYLYNRSQKHDGPNLRVVESMLMNRPLLCDIDPRDGMSKIFTEGYHYIGYNGFTNEDLEEKCKWILDNPEQAQQIAKNGYDEVNRKHTISNRVEQILEVMRA